MGLPYILSLELPLHDAIILQVHEGLCNKELATITQVSVVMVHAEVHKFLIATDSYISIHLDKIVYPCHNLSSITDCFILSK